MFCSVWFGNIVDGIAAFQKLYIVNYEFTMDPLGASLP